MYGFYYNNTAIIKILYVKSKKLVHKHHVYNMFVYSAKK